MHAINYHFANASRRPLFTLLSWGARAKHAMRCVALVAAVIFSSDLGARVRADLRLCLLLRRPSFVVAPPPIIVHYIAHALASTPATRARTHADVATKPIYIHAK